MTPEEQLIHRYFDALNRHDIEGVMACYHEEPVLVSPTGKRCGGREEVRRSYEAEFAMFPDGQCDLRACPGKSGHGGADRFFPQPPPQPRTNTHNPPPNPPPPPTSPPT